MRTAPLIFVGIALPICASLLIASSVGMSAARSSFDETKMAEVYACAFVSGQYAIMNGLPSIFPGDRKTPEFCEAHKVVAAKHGFRQ